MGLNNLGPGDIVVVTELEHHSNFVPWQYIAKRAGADFRMLGSDEQGQLRLDLLDRIGAGGDVKVVASTLVSNALGTINPVEQLARWAHERGAIMVVDAAQAAPHRRLDVQALGCDFLAFSANKLCGPSGSGCALGPCRAAAGDGAVQPRRPHDPRGHVRGDDLGRAALQVRSGNTADRRGGRLRCGNRLPERGRARDNRRARARTDRVRARAARRSPRGGDLWPPPERRAGIVSFNVEGVHPHDVAQILDWEGVAIRAGHHCCQPLMAKLGVPATNRASFYLYTVPEEIERLAGGPAESAKDVRMNAKVRSSQRKERVAAKSDDPVRSSQFNSPTEVA